MDSSIFPSIDLTLDGGGIGRLVDHKRILETKWK